MEEINLSPFVAFGVSYKISMRKLFTDGLLWEFLTSMASHEDA